MSEQYTANSAIVLSVTVNFYICIYVKRLIWLKMRANYKQKRV